jgi:hypothetical protein
MEAVSTSEISVSTRLHSVTSQKTVTWHYSVCLNISVVIFITEQRVQKLKEVPAQTLQIGWKHNLVMFLLISHIGLQAFLPYSHSVTKVS